MKRYTLIALFVLSSLLSACSNDCPTCTTAVSGGQVMNPNNTSQTVLHWLDQFTSDKPDWAK